jgi:hypothetical protein
MYNLCNEHNRRCHLHIYIRIYTWLENRGKITWLRKAGHVYIYIFDICCDWGVRLKV